MSNQTPGQDQAQINAVPWTNGRNLITGAMVSAILTSIVGTFYLYAPLNSPTFTGTVTLPSGTAAANGAIPHVANLSALNLYSPTYSTQVYRDGYATAGDGGQAEYTYSSSACSLNAGAGDSGSQVRASDGGCWLIDAPSSGVSLSVYGFSSSAPDNSAVVLAAAAAASAGVGGGKVLMPATYGKVAQSANLDLSAYPNISIIGNSGVSGLQTTSNLTAPFTLQTNPAYYIVLPHNSKLDGVRIVNMNIELPLSPRAAITMAENFAGTGMVLNNNDTIVQHVTINGYNQAIYSNNAQRLRLDDIVGDDTNFLSAILCNDTCQFTRLEAWNFLTNGNLPTTYDISAITSGPGSTFELTFGNATPPNNTPVTGDTVIVYGITGGSNQPIGRYTVTAIDSTHMTLNGTTYSSGGSGGHIYLPVSLRKGAAFAFTGAGSGGEYLAGLWEYGHDVGFSIGSQHGPTNVHWLWCDGEAGGNLYDNGSACVVSQGWGGGVTTGALLNKSFTVLQNETVVGGVDHPFTISDVGALAVTGCLSSNNANAGAGVQVTGGTVLLTNSNLLGMEACSAGYQALSFGTSATNLKVSNSQLHGATVYYQTAATCPKVVVDGESPNCTPTSSSMACGMNDRMWDASYRYTCTATNSWKRAAHATW